MAGAAILSVTLVPVLMGWLIRGRIPARRAPTQSTGCWPPLYRPVLDWVMRTAPRTTLVHRDPGVR